MKILCIAMLLFPFLCWGETDMVYPWVSNQPQFRSRLAINNLNGVDAEVTLTATRAWGSDPESQTITLTMGPWTQIVRDAGDLFAELGEGTGYLVRLTSSMDHITGGYVLTGTGTASGASPSQANVANTNEAHSPILFNLVPSNSDTFAGIVVNNVSQQDATITYHAYQDGYEAGLAVRACAPWHPIALMVTDLFPNLEGDAYIVAESAQPLIGATFIFNEMREPSMANAVAIDEMPTPTGFKTSTPEQQGVDSEQLAAVMDALFADEHYLVHSLSIIRHGCLITDACFYPYRRGDPHNLASVAKSILSVITGIAIEQQYIESVDTHVLDFFSERDIANLDARKQAITIEHLLTMTSGLSAYYPDLESLHMAHVSDWVQYVLDLPMARDPGSPPRVYCSSNHYLLSAVMSQATGVSALEFGNNNLFEPLNIKNVFWPAPRPDGIVYGAGSIVMTPYDLAKIGCLYLDKGLWLGQQLVSSQWIDRSTSPLIDNWYGYSWGSYSDPEAFETAGAGGQRMIVYPELDMVIVLTAGGHFRENEDEFFYRLFRDEIRPAIRSPEELPPNQNGLELLQSKIYQAGRPPKTEPDVVPSHPQVAYDISGTPYTFDDNPIGIETATLTFGTNDDAVLRITTDGVVLWDDDFQYAIGLDGIDRYSPAEYDIPAACTGTWETDQTFFINVNQIGNIGLMHFWLTYDGDELTVRIESPLELNPPEPLVIQGRKSGPGKGE